MVEKKEQIWSHTHNSFYLLNKYKKKKKRLTHPEDDLKFFQKLLKAEANRRVRMCNLQSAKDCASVKTSLATVHARAQEMKNIHRVFHRLYTRDSRARTICGCDTPPPWLGLFSSTPITYPSHLV